MSASNNPQLPLPPPTLQQMLLDLFRTVSSQARMYVDLYNKNFALQSDVNRLALEVNALRARIGDLESQ